MQTKYVFRRAAVKDLDRFFGVFKKSIRAQFPDYSPKTKNFLLAEEFNVNFLKSQIKIRRMAIYLALNGRDIVGFLMAVPLVGGVGMASWMAVIPEHQGKGIASRLLKMWEADSKKAGLHKLHLWTDERNIDFYKKRGFKLAGRIPEDFYGAHDYFFHKTIQKPIEKNYLQKQYRI